MTTNKWKLVQLGCILVLVSSVIYLAFQTSSARSDADKAKKALTAQTQKLHGVEAERDSANATVSEFEGCTEQLMNLDIVTNDYYGTVTMRQDDIGPILVCLDTAAGNGGTY